MSDATPISADAIKEDEIQYGSTGMTREELDEKSARLLSSAWK